MTKPINKPRMYDLKTIAGRKWYQEAQDKSTWGRLGEAYVQQCMEKG